MQNIKKRGKKNEKENFVSYRAIACSCFDADSLRRLQAWQNN
jgi:hypothetical protein